MYKVEISLYDKGLIMQVSTILECGKAKSETSFGINLAALVIAACVLFATHFLVGGNGTQLFILFVFVLTICVISLECVFYPETCFYSRWKIRRNINWKRVLYKEVVFLTTMVVIAFFYWLLPVFKNEMFTNEYFPFLSYLAPFMLIASLPYFCLMDKLDEDPNDVYYKLGKSICSFSKQVTSFEFCNYVRSWLIKVIYLSLMQPYMVENIQYLLNLAWEKVKDTPLEWFYLANSCCFTIDLAYAATGYLVNLKILNSHTRTAEPTLFGWMVAIMCYYPFWGILFYPYFFRYDEVGWLNIFETGSPWWWLWFVLIIALEFFYALATVAAGFRFSNLTYRGLFNTGPYKWTKHPAYVFKNISWWLISMPFMAAEPVMAVKLSLLLFANNIVYYLRAKTEERHLSHYPEYVAYALEMNEKSIFRGLTKIFPFLKYKPLRDEERLF